MAIFICQGILEMADLVEGGGQDSPGEAVVYFANYVAECPKEIHLKYTLQGKYIQ
jgi:hypothetical protein